MNQLLSSLVQQVTSSGYKSTIVKSLIGMIVVLFCVSMGFYKVGNIFFGNLVAFLGVIFVLLYGATYIYCLLKNPDLLRSERYNLEKTAMQNVRISGDSQNAKLNPVNRDFVVYPAETVEAIETDEEK